MFSSKYKLYRSWTIDWLEFDEHRIKICYLASKQIFLVSNNWYKLVLKNCWTIFSSKNVSPSDLEIFLTIRLLKKAKVCDWFDLLFPTLKDFFLSFILVLKKILVNNFIPICHFHASAFRYLREFFHSLSFRLFLNSHLNNLLGFRKPKFFQ